MANKTHIENLTEIKRGQTGHGLLIESDGYVSRYLTDNNNRIITEAFESNQQGVWNVPKPFVLDVVLQKFGIKNANGRIYPEHVLKPEVEKYQKLIQDHMALGECYTEDAECLTSNGWVSIKDVDVNTEVVTLNVETQQIEIQKVTYKTETDWNSELVHIQDYYIDDYVTPNHGFPIYKLDNDCNCVFYEFITAKELMENHGCIYLPYILNGEIHFQNMVNTEYSLVPFNGKVYCIETPNHTWYVRQNGHEHFTKNCNHPETSNIDLGRISHNIVECHWENNTLVGKIEFNLTEGFRKYGICSSLGDTCVNLILNGYRIGVSSRGVGDVVTKLGITYVNTYELICWDVVATPSTPGSYIGQREELEPFIENDTSHQNKSSLNEKIYRINQIL